MKISFFLELFSTSYKYPCQTAYNLLSLFIKKILVLSRYVIVCHAHKVHGKEKRIGKLFKNCLLLTSLYEGLASLTVTKHVHSYMLCMGQEEDWKMNLKNPFEPVIKGFATKLPFFHYYRFSILILGFSFIFIVPIIYFKIFYFRWKHDKKIKGKCI